MASTYVNNLRLNEMATGDASGTWGTTTNTNLELVGQALGYGTEAITTNADTHASTVADGAADEARAMYIKYTGTLDSACTITIGPNTLKRVHIIENATSGSQSIIIKQGSGATVTIPTGRVAVVYLDGAGSGAAVTNAFTDLDLAGTLSIAGAVAAATDMTVGDDLTLSSDAGVLGFGADTDVTLTHVADTGLLLNSSRQLQFGDSGTYIHQSADGVLDLVADTEIEINATTIDINGAVDISGNALVSGEVQTANIGYTDGDNAITIADGGGITAANGITSTAASNTFGATSFNDADITNVGSIALDTITNDGTDITLDSSGDIVLDADGGEIKIGDDGVKAEISFPSNSLQFYSSTSDADIIFKGNDGGSTITALTLDMSNAGKAAFNAGASFASNVSISTADNTDTLTLVSTDADASVGPVLVFDRTSSSPADNDRVGSIVFQARNDAAEDTDYFTNNVQIKDASNGTEDAAVEFNIMRAGTLTSMMQFDVSETVFNDGSLDTDFRVESSSNSNMLFVDAGNDRVGIGDSPSGGQLDVKSQLNMTNSGNVSLTGLKATTFGYSSSYKVLQLGDSASSTAANVAIGVDLSGNSSGAFSGSGERVYFRNGINLATPNSSNNGFHNYLQLNDGQINATVPIAIGGTAAANALDDYEEGTWTPAYDNGGSIAYTTQYGSYVKIGRLVHLACNIDVDTVSGTNSSAMQISGAPFTNDGVDETGGSVGINLSGWLNGSGSDTIQINATNASILPAKDTINDIYRGTDIGTGFVRWTIVYMTDQ